MLNGYTEMIPNPHAIRKPRAFLWQLKALGWIPNRISLRLPLTRCLVLGAALVMAPCAKAQMSDTLSIAFLSDTQDPTWYESLVLRTYHNSLAREMILGEILDRQPRAVVHLGDIVSAGSEPERWGRIDRFTDSLRAKAIRFLPIRGNHDHFYLPAWGNRNFEQRYPHMSRTGTVVRYGTTAIVLLNSNFLHLTETEQQSQAAWYKKTLSALDADSSVEFVIVGCHHSPYTNSTIVPPSAEVDTAFVPAYLEARKAVLFVSGHAHAYEHYQRGGKDFLVIGGGGGLLQPLLTGTRQRYEDLFVAGGKTRMYHYLWCTVGPDRLRFEVRMIRGDLSGFDRVDSLEFSPLKHTEAFSGKENTPSP